MTCTFICCMKVSFPLYVKITITYVEIRNVRSRFWYVLQPIWLVLKRNTVLLSYVRCYALGYYGTSNAFQHIYFHVVAICSKFKIITDAFSLFMESALINKIFLFHIS